MKKLSLGVLLAIISTATIADVISTPESSFKPYVGAEIHVKHIRDKNRNDQVKLLMSGGGAHAGLKFTDYVGVEAGLHIAKRKKYMSRYTHKGYSLQVMGYIPFDAISLVGGLGFTHVNLRVQNESRKVIDHRPIPKVSVGFMVHITDNIATRYMASWEKTSSLGKKHNWELKDSLHHQLGVVYTF